MKAIVTKPDASIAAIVGFHLHIKDGESLQFLAQAFADHRAKSGKILTELKQEKYLLQESVRKLESDINQLSRELAQTRARNGE